MSEADEQRKIEGMTRIMLRPLASPLPLAFFAFGVGSILQSGLQFGLMPQSEIQSLALIYGAFVFPLQALAAVFCFFTRETLAATGLGLIAFSWLSTALIEYTTPSDSTSAALGLLSFILAILLLSLGVIGILGKPLLSVIILLAFFRYTSNGIYEFTTFPAFEMISGVFGCVIFAFALYSGLAFGLEDVQHRTILPIGRRGEAKRAFEGDLGEQIGPVEREAGVRKQL